MSELTIDYEKKYRKLIISLSVIIPLAVAALFGIKIKGFDTSFLPPVYATINGLTAVFLLLAVMMIKRGNRKMHEKLVKFCILLSVTFLAMYVTYHITSDSTKYGGEGILKYIYFFILITHIILSVVIIPMVLFTYVKAWSGKFVDHRRLARVTFPLWFYVAVSGVVVYLMISPYYL
jgi:putative membrane protein